ncbi:pyridoxine/pyridoxamine 5'-phosphate oxidase [Cnuibacter physcomitrellae]|nr:pyridoxal 5'-phosphate synthase [Cnuibacter physcomitrellae]GGI38620.1 pyridoxine/pyridoxamine 5'-phosphate oxidase [Cnuibacter physcomitrellae]
MTDARSMGTPLSGTETADLPEFTEAPAEPLALAREWLAAAREIGVSEPLSMTLATASSSGSVSARSVDVKRIDDTGLVFGTSLESRKGGVLLENPHAALQAYWRETMQQLRFEGVVEVLGGAESDALFADRSPRSRAATAVAAQSVPFATGPAEGRAALADAAERLLDEHGDDVPRPPAWRALRLVPDYVEFWLGRRDRLHRRLRYLRVEGGWVADHLQP